MQKKSNPPPAIELRGQHIAPVFLDRRISRFQIVGGSRLKPNMAIKALGLTNPVVEDINCGEEIGRIRLVTGDFNYNKSDPNKTIRITFAETGMGMATSDIIMRELAYSADGTPVVQIRAGTAGGMNSRNLDEPVLRLGDLVIAESNIGSSNTIFQAMGYFPKVIPDRQSKKELAKFLNEWYALRGKVTPDGRFLQMDNQYTLTFALEKSAEHLGYPYYKGNSFSKDCLYGEDAEEIMLSLREKNGVLASEMEQLVNAFLMNVIKAKYKVALYSAMVLAVIGAVPGPGFPDKKDKAQMKLQEETEEKALRIAALAMKIFDNIDRNLFR